MLVNMAGGKPLYREARSKLVQAILDGRKEGGEGGGRGGGRAP